ncbi:serine hydrolase domain-containing protein [Kitasatospora sp. NPDC088391]|uniref:serine hydrolase domain-containing protein n=1 Tax=Kitasatospora sp. NPDC088391 TaxID=3364074 RepID=UPI0038296F2F
MDSELLPATRRTLDHRLATAQAEARVPTLVAALARGGEQVWSGVRGAADGRFDPLRTQFRIGSITKTFTAALVLRLRDEGALALDGPIGAHLDGLPPEVAAVTPRQLLLHTSGLTSEPPGPWASRTPGRLRPALADLFQEPPLRHPPGAVHHYSNVGYALLGALAARIRRAPWDEVLRAELLHPLGMDRTGRTAQAPAAEGWAVHPHADVLQREPAEDSGLLAPAGQYWSTAGDLLRWARFLTEGEPGVLDAATVREMRQPATAGSAGYGLGLDLGSAHGLDLFGHTGSVPGFRAGLFVAPGAGLAAVALADSGSFPGGIDSLVHDLLATVERHEPRFPEPWRPMPDADPDLLALTGRWYWGPVPFTLGLRAGRRLELAPHGGGPDLLHPQPDGTWTGHDGSWHGETLRVVRPPDGAAPYLEVGTLVLTREPYPAPGPTPGGTDPEGWRGRP